ncbi:hypothetical protein GQ42DRAFT_42295 [Ramicandelaber brevisporus]|nr:hypothetical protein GQ42DRAFT_42295 [Ramicandelaber brevisporus]
MTGITVLRDSKGKILDASHADTHGRDSGGHADETRLFYEAEAAECRRRATIATLPLDAAYWRERARAADFKAKAYGSCRCGCSTVCKSGAVSCDWHRDVLGIDECVEAKDAETIRPGVFVHAGCIDDTRRYLSVVKVAVDDAQYSSLVLEGLSGELESTVDSSIAAATTPSNAPVPQPLRLVFVNSDKADPVMIKRSFETRCHPSINHLDTSILIESN